MESSEALPIFFLKTWPVHAGLLFQSLHDILSDQEKNYG